MLKELFVKPGFLQWHRIDCCDFHSIDKKDIFDELYYLKIPTMVWEFLTSKYLNY